MQETGEEHLVAQPAEKGACRVLMAVFNPIEFDGRVKRAAEALSMKYQVTLFCPSIAGRSAEYELSDGIQVKRAWLPWKKWPTTLSLAVFWLQFLYLAVVIRPTLIYSHDFYLPFPGLLAAKLVRALSVYDAHELIIPRGLRQRSVADGIYSSLEQVTVRYHNLVIAANPERAELMREYYRLDTLPTPIRNVSKATRGSVDQAAILERYPELRRHGDEVLLVYMGCVAVARGLAAVIGALDYLPDNVSLILVGDGPDRSRLEGECAAVGPMGNKRIRFLGEIQQLWIQDVLSLCHVGIVVYSNEGLNSYYCSPNKIFEYTQAGLPVVTTAQPPLVTMVKDYNIGRIAGTMGKNVDPKDFARAIREVLDERAVFLTNIDRFLTEYTSENEQRRLFCKVREIVGG